MLAEAQNNIFADRLSSIKQLLTETVINNHPGGRVGGGVKGTIWHIGEYFLRTNFIISLPLYLTSLASSLESEPNA